MKVDPVLAREEVLVVASPPNEEEGEEEEPRSFDVDREFFRVVVVVAEEEDGTPLFEEFLPATAPDKFSTPPPPRAPLRFGEAKFRVPMRSVFDGETAVLWSVTLARLLDVGC